MTTTTHIKFGDGLDVTDEGGGTIRVDGSSGPAGATGPAGPTGATGAAGATGPAGPGVPVGGSTGQVLTKTSATDYATNWQTPAGGGAGHTVQDEGSALTARTGLNFVGAGVTAADDSANNRTNVTIPGGGSLPAVGANGEVLTVVSGAWASAPPTIEVEY